MCNVCSIGEFMDCYGSVYKVYSIECYIHIHPLKSISSLTMSDELNKNDLTVLISLIPYNYVNVQCDPTDLLNVLSKVESYSPTLASWLARLPVIGYLNVDICWYHYDTQTPGIATHIVALNPVLMRSYREINGDMSLYVDLFKREDRLSEIKNSDNSDNSDNDVEIKHLMLDDIPIEKQSITNLIDRLNVIRSLGNMTERAWIEIMNAVHTHYIPRLIAVIGDAAMRIRVSELKNGEKNNGEKNNEKNVTNNTINSTEDRQLADCLTRSLSGFLQFQTTKGATTARDCLKKHGYRALMIFQSQYDLKRIAGIPFTAGDLNLHDRSLLINNILSNVKSHCRYIGRLNRVRLLSLRGCYVKCGKTESSRKFNGCKHPYDNTDKKYLTYAPYDLIENVGRGGKARLMPRDCEDLSIAGKKIASGINEEAHELSLSPPMPMNELIEGLIADISSVTVLY